MAPPRARALLSRGLQAAGRAAAAAACAASMAASAAPPSTTSESVSIGLGRYFTQPHGSAVAAAHAMKAPEAKFVGGQMIGKAIPSDQWYSSVAYQFPSAPIDALPMSYRTGEIGFELCLPAKHVEHRASGAVRIRYPHEPAITVALGAPIQGARLALVSDWMVQIQMGTATGQTMLATVLHGSPFSYYEVAATDISLRLGAPATVIEAADARVAVFRIGTTAYAAFAPKGSRWTWRNPGVLDLHLPLRRRFFSIAALPDDQPATVAEFAALAYAFPRETHVTWRVDEASGDVRSRFDVVTVAREGPNRKTLLGLYPHQWFGQPVEAQLAHRYDSARGPIRLLTGNDFEIQQKYHGFVPYWPAVRDPEAVKSIGEALAQDSRTSPGRKRPGAAEGATETGRTLSALAQLMDVADAQGDGTTRDALLRQIEATMQDWFDGAHAGYFVQDPHSGGFIAYPQRPGANPLADSRLDSYGYWIFAAAQVALRDPGWASEQQWGGMIGKLVNDIAAIGDGASDPPFPRGFDPYEGHSWASGTADSADGNTQPSFAEAINGWAGLIILGSATANRPLRDLGIYLYTSETAAALAYGLDVHHLVFAPEFGRPFATSVSGGAYSYGDPAGPAKQAPEHLLAHFVQPLTTASTYLAVDPASVRACVATLDGAAASEGGASGSSTMAKVQDLIARFLALADPATALARSNKDAALVPGQTGSPTMHWIHSLAEMGDPDPATTADTPLYAVFRKADRSATYLAYNAGAQASEVHFSDGKTVAVAPHSLARAP
jgi:endoglucanase Acf2